MLYDNIALINIKQVDNNIQINLITLLVLLPFTCGPSNFLIETVITKSVNKPTRTQIPNGL